MPPPATTSAYAPSMPQGDDGLCWWTPNQLTTDLKKPETGKRRPGTSGERGEQGVEFHTAAVAAQACGARVLLGDRDLEVCVRNSSLPTDGHPFTKRYTASVSLTWHWPGRNFRVTPCEQGVTPLGTVAFVL